MITKNFFDQLFWKRYSQKHLSHLLSCTVLFAYFDFSISNGCTSMDQQKWNKLRINHVVAEESFIISTTTSLLKHLLFCFLKMALNTLSFIFMISKSPEIRTLLLPQSYGHSMFALYKYISPPTFHCQILVRLLKWTYICQPWRYQLQCLPDLWKTFRILHSLFPKAKII
jgi:hypothetical protein